MKKPQFGADKKKLAALGVILAVGGYFTWQNFFSDPLGTPAPKKTVSTAVNELTRPSVPGAPRVAANARPTRQDFKPSIKQSSQSSEPRASASRFAIDPTLRLDLLAKLRNVQLGGVDRSLFDFSSAPVSKQPEPSIVVKKPAPKMIGPEPPPPPPPPPAPKVKPPPPPIPFKFYGMLTPRGGGARRAFLLDGEEIFTPAEGDTVKKRYKIVRVGVNSVVVEDLDFQAQQTLTLAEEPAG